MIRSEPWIANDHIRKFRTNPVFWNNIVTSCSIILRRKGLGLNASIDGSFAMATATALRSLDDIESFMVDYRLRNYTGIIAASLAAALWVGLTLLPIGPAVAPGSASGHLR